MGVMGRVGLGLVALSLAVVAVPAVAEEVSLDPTFSVDGKARVAEEPSVAGAVVAHAGMVYVGGWHRPNDKHRPYAGGESCGLRPESLAAWHLTRNYP